MIHTLTEVDRLIELAIIQRSELKKLVDSLPELRTHLSIEIEKNVEQIEPHLRAELEVFLSARAKDENAKLGEMLQSKIETLCDDLETTTAAKYSAITLYKEKVIDLEKIAEKKITEAGERIGVEVPAQVEKLVEEKFARFPRAGEIDQLRKEFAEPKGLNPRGKWESGVTYYKLDLVAYNGDSYVANEETTQKPSRTSTKWTLNSARGAAGSGNSTTLAELTGSPANGQILIGSNGAYVNADITAGDGIAISTAAGFIEISADGGTNYQGTWDAATNNPALTSSVGTKGYYYVVNVDGSTNLNGITDWKVGDWAIYNGSVWQKVDNSESVTSVFGRVGSITAVAGDYSATQITNTAAGSITATNVQDAINELDGEKLAKASNLSDVASVTTSRTNLGVTATGADTTYAYRANNLNDLASVTSARSNLGLGSAAVESATFFLQSANSLSDVASVALARTNLGLGSIATQSAGNVTITGGTITGITDLAIADGGTGASNADDARTNLGLGSAAVQSATYFLQVANNLSDVASVALARTNLGLGNSATRDVGTTAGTVAAGDDARFTDSRTPTGPAGGDLTGTYPNPSLTISGVTAGGYGSASSAVVITLDSKGRATSASAVNIQIAESQVTNLVTDLASKIPSTEKGANSGVATLDSGGKIPLTQLPDSILGQVTYMGTWNASTNSPTLANPPATTTLGDYYIVTTGGTFASITFNVGDWIISNGADGWAKVDNTDAVASVFGRTGTVTATNGDYTASNITNVPAGNIVATEVQAAINELDGDKLAKASNLSDLVSPSTARTNLGLGSAATQNDTYFLQVANNLSDLASVTTARSNLGLGTMAVQNAASVSITGGSITGITDLAVADGGTGVSTTPANGQLLIGNGTGYTVANLTAGTGVTITNSSGGISIATTGAQSAETLTATVTNAESTTITKGQVVYAFGATGNRMSVKLANNSADATSAKTLGIVSDASIAANGTGTITLVGVVDGLTLGSYADGDQLYLGATAGSLTNVKPYAPNHLVYVGIVERANNGNGELYVRVQNGYELNELHDVQITTTPSSGALLVYDATNALWKAARITAGTNIAITNADASVTVGITGVIAGTNGGTGVNNGANTITIAGNVTHAGAFTQTFTATANTSLTLPVTGTLATLAGSEALSNKTITASAFNGTVGATTPSTGAFTTGTFTATGQVQYFSGATTASKYIRLENTGGNSYFGIEGATPAFGGTAYAAFLFAPSEIDMLVGSVKVGAFTATGLNSTPIGVTTPSTVAATTIAATSGFTANQAANTVSNGFLAVAVGGAINGGMFHDGTGLVLRENAVNIVKVTGSTGLAVTGALSSTTLYQGASGAQGLNVGFSGAAGQGFSLRDTTNSRTYFFTTETSTGLQINAGANPISLIASSLAVTGALSATGDVGIGAAPNAGFALDITRSGVDVKQRMANSSSGNVQISMTTVGQQDWAFGVDRSDSGKFKIAASGAVASSTAITLTPSGNVGIAISSPAGAFDVRGNGQAVTTIFYGNTSSNASYPTIMRSSSGDNLFYVRSDGLVVMPKVYSDWTTASAANVNINSDGNLYRSTSSQKYKRNITDYTRGLADVLKLRPVFYKGKSENDGENQFAGLIAEDVAEAGLDEFVVKDADGTPDALAYSNMVALTVKAIQELNANLVAQVAALSQRLAALETK